MKYYWHESRYWMISDDSIVEVTVNHRSESYGLRYMKRSGDILPDNRLQETTQETFQQNYTFVKEFIDKTETTSNSTPCVNWKEIATALARGLSEPIDYIGVGEDITETKQAVKALTLYREAIKQDPDADK